MIIRIFYKSQDQKSFNFLATYNHDPVDMRFLDVSQMTVGQVRCTVKLVSYTGDLGYTIFCIPMDQGKLWKISGKMAHFWASPLWHARDDVAAPRSFFWLMVV